MQTKKEAWHHWINHGSLEGRICKKNESANQKELFDWVFYINNYDDLKHAQTEEEAWQHWINHGYHEGRICKK